MICVGFGDDFGAFWSTQSWLFQHPLMCLRLPDMSWFKWRVNIGGSLSVSNQFSPCFIWVCARADRLGNCIICICESETAGCYFRVVLLCCWENLHRTPMFFFKVKAQGFPSRFFQAICQKGWPRGPELDPCIYDVSECSRVSQGGSCRIRCKASQVELCFWSGALNGWNMLKYDIGLSENMVYSQWNSHLKTG